MTKQKKGPGGGNRKGALVSLNSDYALKILNGQAQSGYFVELSFRRNEDAEHELHYVGASDEARSLLLIARHKKGITRAEALGEYWILCLTQHVRLIRKHCVFFNVIDTERVGPKRYARYHLPEGVSIRLFQNGGR